MSQSNHEDGIRPLPRKRHEIIRIAERFAEKVFPGPDVPRGYWKLTFDRVYDEIIYPDYGVLIEEEVNLGFDEHGKKILGMFDPLNNIAYIDKSVNASAGDPRRAFVLWHEVGGHAVLQGEWLRQEHERLQGKLVAATTADSLDFKTEIEFEKQANLFAAHAAAPTRLLNRAIVEQLQPAHPFRFDGPRDYTIGNKCGAFLRWHCETANDLCRIIAKQIQYQFGYLSIEALSYRIEGLPIVEDTTKPRSLRFNRAQSDRKTRHLTTTF